MALSLPMIAILKVVFDNVEDLKPFGYILGEPDHKKIQMERKRDIRNVVPDLVESIVETTEDVRSIVTGKRRRGKVEKND
jgi:hypothetical protein